MKVFGKKHGRNKMKIYYLLSRAAVLKPKSGDSISELNIIKALSKFADVYYNGVKFIEGHIVGKPTIDVPSSNYDLYYIRANPVVAKRVPKERLIYFATPFDEAVFKRSLAIAAFTEAWSRDMRTDFSFTKSIYEGKDQQDMIRGKNIYTVNQVIDPAFYVRDKSRIRQIRNTVGRDSFVLGVFGRIANSCYPNLLLQAIPKIKKVLPNFKVLLATSDRYVELLKRDSRYLAAEDAFIAKRFDYADMPSVISACDASFYTYTDYQGDFAGSMKVLESMACRVPVISPRYAAREIELGSDYPLFLEKVPKTSGIYNYSEEIVDELVNKVLALQNKDFAAALGKELGKRSLEYDLNTSSKKLEKTFNKIFESRKKYV